jgi:membrane protease YdiL (CAAX protease family)
METTVPEEMTGQRLETRRLAIFLAFAFGIAWIVGLIIYLTGGLVNSPVILPTLNVSLALVLLASGYMWAPTLANIITRLVTREGKKELMLRPQFKRGWPYWLVGWFLPGILTILGIVVYFVIFPAQFDPTFKILQQALENMARQTGQAIPMTAQTYFLVQLGLALLISPIANLIGTFGEEFGWRAYLLPKLLPLGARKALLIIGVIWGIWHWPVIFMGYEYGFGYWGAPVVGPLLFLFFTTSLSIIFGWLVLRAGSVWPAAIAHGAINGIAAVGLYAMNGKPYTLLGPAPVGLLSGLPLIVAALVILFSKKALR